MKQVKSIFDIESIMGLIHFQIDPGYELEIMDLTAEIIEENELFDDEQRETLDLVWNDIIHKTKKVEVPDYLKDFFIEYREELKKRYTVMREIKDPGYCVFEKTFRQGLNLDWLVKYAMDLGCARAAIAHGHFLLGEGDVVGATDAYLKAAKLGDLNGYLLYAEWFDHDKRKRSKEVIEALKKGAELGSGECALRLVECELTDEPRKYLALAKKLHAQGYHAAKGGYLLLHEEDGEGAVEEWMEGVKENEAESFIQMAKLYLYGANSHGLDIKKDPGLALAYSDPYARYNPESLIVNAQAKLASDQSAESALRQIGKALQNRNIDNNTAAKGLLTLASCMLGEYGDFIAEIAVSMYDPKDVKSMIEDNMNSGWAFYGALKEALQQLRNKYHTEDA